MHKDPKRGKGWIYEFAEEVIIKGDQPYLIALLVWLLGISTFLAVENDTSTYLRTILPRAWFSSYVPGILISFVISPISYLMNGAIVHFGLFIAGGRELPFAAARRFAFFLLLPVQIIAIPAVMANALAYGDEYFTLNKELITPIGNKIILGLLIPALICCFYIIFKIGTYIKHASGWRLLGGILIGYFLLLLGLLTLGPLFSALLIILAYLALILNQKHNTLSK